MRKIDMVVAVVLLAIAGYVIWVTESYPAQSETLGPAFFPRLVSGLLSAFALGALISAVFAREKVERPAAPQRPLILILICLGAYIVALPRLGFLFSTPPFLIAAGLFLCGDVRRWWKPMAAVAALSTAALYVLFVVLLKTPLP
jgi:hypothetical protein